MKNWTVCFFNFHKCYNIENERTQTKEGRLLVYSGAQAEDIFAQFSPDATQAVKNGIEKAKQFNSPYVEVEHIVLALVEDIAIFEAIETAGIDAKKLQDDLFNQISRGEFSGEPQFSSHTKQFLDEARGVSQKNGGQFVTAIDLLQVALSHEDYLAAKVLKEDGLDAKKLEQAAAKIKNEQSEGASAAEGGSVKGPSGEVKKSTLDTYTTDLTAKAKEGKLDPVIGREKEVERVMEIITRRTKNNPVLVGEAGVGKTAVVEGLATQIASGNIPDPLREKKILTLDLSLLVAGASHRGEFEQRMEQLIGEVKAASGKIILFIDEIHTIVGAGAGEGALDASNILKPALARGEIQVIGATTVKEFRQYIEKDAAFERRFQRVMVEEPLEDVAVKMLEGIKSKYEEHHKVKIEPKAIDAAVRLSARYISDRFLPDKAIDVIDEACAKVVLKKIQPPVVNEDIVRQVISDWSGVPVSRLNESEMQILLKLEDLIHKRLIDQEPAVKAVSEAIRRNRAGLKNPKRPVGSFIFMGPTGVGKTELAKTLAEVMFGAEDKMIRLDMSEYMEKNATARMIGAPPGYVGYEEGGQLTEAVRKNPYSVVLFDEIEKADKQVFNIFLQILDDGRLTDSKGRTVDFKNTVIICTSNVGTELIRSSNIDDPNLQKMITNELLKTFKPEFVNRFDDVVVFRGLRAQDMAAIVEIMVGSLTKLLAEQKVTVSISPTAKEKLGQLGFDPVFGARPLRRVIQKYVENPLSLSIIKGEIKEGQSVQVDLTADGKFVFKSQPGAGSPASAEATVGKQPSAVSSQQSGNTNIQNAPRPPGVALRAESTPNTPPVIPPPPPAPPPVAPVGANNQTMAAGQ